MRKWCAAGVLFTVMLQETVDMVAGYFNGAAWRRQSGNGHRHISTIKEAFCQHVLTFFTGTHTSVVTMWCTRWMGSRMRIYLSSHRGPRQSGMFACTVRSKFLTVRSALNLQTRAATTKSGFISSTSTNDWLIAHPVRTNIGDQA